LREGATIPNPRETTSPANFLDWKRQTDVFERLAAFEWWDVNLVGRDEPERVQGFFVSTDFFPALGVQPVYGRTFVAEEEAVGQHRRAVIGYGLWQRPSAATGRSSGNQSHSTAKPMKVIGIAPPKFDFPNGVEIWAPLAFSAETSARRNSHYLTVIGRLAPDRTLDEARPQMAVIGDNLLRQYPEANRGRTTHVLTLARGMMDQGLGPVLSL
jgi:putative ABC transport system permease protein